jgi:hypothetical protein
MDAATRKFRITFEGQEPMVSLSDMAELRLCAPDAVQYLEAAKVGEIVTVGGGAAPYVMMERVS